MDIPFLNRWQARHAPARGITVLPDPGSGGGTTGSDPARVAELLSECELLREQAAAAGVELDDSPASLARLDQLMPRWREDDERASWLGNDAGLYLGTVVLLTVPGAAWEVWPNGHPVIRLAGGREVDVVELGHSWAAEGVPELSAVYSEIAEG